MRYTIDCYKQDVHFTENCFFRSSHGKLPVRALLPIQMCMTKLSLMCTPRPNPKPFSVLKGVYKASKMTKIGQRVQSFYFLFVPTGVTGNYKQSPSKMHRSHSWKTWRPHGKTHQTPNITMQSSCRGGLQNEDSRRYSTVNKNTSSSQIVVMGVNAKLGVLWKTLAKQHKEQQQ